MDRAELVAFVRARRLGVVATLGPGGTPQAALVGLATTDRGELVFDCSRGSRKFANVERSPEVAVVVGGEDEVTVQLEGEADIPTGAELERCRTAYLAEFPDGAGRAASRDIGYVRVTPRWLRCADYRPETFGTSETTL